MRKILAIILIILFLPISLGISTINGKYCSHGHCVDVIPFWGGVMQGIFIELILALIGCFFYLVTYLFFYEKSE